LSIRSFQATCLDVDVANIKRVENIKEKSLWDDVTPMMCRGGVKTSKGKRKYMTVNLRYGVVTSWGKRFFFRVAGGKGRGEMVCAGDNFRPNRW